MTRRDPASPAAPDPTALGTGPRWPRSAEAPLRNRGIDTRPGRDRPSPMGGTSFPGNARRAVITYYGTQPIVASMIRAISVIYGRAMDQASRLWRPFDSGDAFSGAGFRGYEADLQGFSGMLITPSAANVRYGLNQLLPGTTSLPNDARNSQGFTAPAAHVTDLLPGEPGI